MACTWPMAPTHPCFVAWPGRRRTTWRIWLIAARVGQVLERRGLVERDIENARLAAGAEPGPLDDLIGHSITYRIAVDPRAGQKLFTLQTVPPRSGNARYCRTFSV